MSGTTEEDDYNDEPYGDEVRDNEVINNMPIIFNGRPAEEFVDMIIVFMSARAKLGFTPLTEMIAAKLEINKNRVWGFETSNGDRPRIK